MKEVVARLSMPESAHRVLDHHDGSVDDEPEVDRTEAHQTAGDPDLHHRAEREEHRERDGCGDDERCTEVPEQDEEHHDDEDGALDEVLLHRPDRATDEVRPVIEGRESDARR